MSEDREIGWSPNSKVIENWYQSGKVIPVSKRDPEEQRRKRAKHTDVVRALVTSRKWNYETFYEVWKIEQIKRSSPKISAFGFFYKQRATQVPMEQVYDYFFSSHALYEVRWGYPKNNVVHSVPRYMDERILEKVRTKEREHDDITDALRYASCADRRKKAALNPLAKENLMGSVNLEEINTVQTRRVIVTQAGDVELRDMSVDQIMAEVKKQKEMIKGIEEHGLNDVPVIKDRIAKHEATIDALRAELMGRTANGQADSNNAE